MSDRKKTAKSDGRTLNKNLLSVSFPCKEIPCPKIPQKVITKTNVNLATEYIHTRGEYKGGSLSYVPLYLASYTQDQHEMKIKLLPVYNFTNSAQGVDFKKLVRFINQDI